MTHNHDKVGITKVSQAKNMASRTGAESIPRTCYHPPNRSLSLCHTAHELSVYQPKVLGRFQIKFRFASMSILRTYDNLYTAFS